MYLVLKMLRQLICYLLGVCLLVFSMEGSAFDDTDLKKFKSMNICDHCDLSGADSSGEDIHYAGLNYVNLSGAIFVRTKLWGSNLKGVNLSDATLIGADLSDSVFWGADLTEAWIRPESYLGAQFQGENLSGAKLTRFKAAYSD